MQVCSKTLLQNKVRSHVFPRPQASQPENMQGMHGNKVEDLTKTLTVIFENFKMSNKTEILLAYNCEYVFSAFNFMLLFH